MSKQAPSKARAGLTSPTNKPDDPSPKAPSSGSAQRASIPKKIPVSLSTVAAGPAPSHEQIALRAYQLWEANGWRAGTDRENWFQAERLLRTEAR